jgi:hypothetical protein
LASLTTDVAFWKPCLKDVWTSPHVTFGEKGASVCESWSLRFAVYVFAHWVSLALSPPRLVCWCVSLG